MSSLSHLPGGLVGECDGGNIVGSDTASTNEMDDFICDDPGFSATGSGKHEQGRAEVFHGFSLCRVELGF